MGGSIPILLIIVLEGRGGVSEGVLSSVGIPG